MHMDASTASKPTTAIIGDLPSSAQAVTERVYNCPQREYPYPGFPGGIKEASPHHAPRRCHEMALYLDMEHFES